MQSIAIVTPSGDYHPSGPDAESIEDTARKTNLGRSLIYRAIHPDPAVRGELPFLPSLKVGRRRLVRVEARRAWLAQLEAASAVNSGASAV